MGSRRGKPHSQTEKIGRGLFLPSPILPNSVKDRYSSKSRKDQNLPDETRIQTWRETKKEMEKENKDTGRKKSGWSLLVDFMICF